MRRRQGDKRIKKLYGKLCCVQLFRIDEVFRLDVVKHFCEIFAGFITCHGQVVEQVVAAVAWRGTRNVALVVGDEGEAASHEVDDVAALEVAAHEEVVACQAAHGAPVDYAVFPLRVIAQEGGGEMLDGVYGAVVEHGLAVRFFHADVERCYGLAAHGVLA